ncbi:hypothetical protein CQJ27_01260 [Escherichia sp. E1130]|nr:hypothetical protein CQJ27_01260 [Escherichia sp. E1130]TLI62965.1 hypothetical protein FEK66_24030 [Escherichia sp. E1130]
MAYASDKSGQLTCSGSVVTSTDLTLFLLRMAGGRKQVAIIYDVAVFTLYKKFPVSTISLQIKHE